MNLSRFSDIEVRAFVIDGVAWYVAKDIGLVLDYKNTADAITRHCKNAREANTFTKVREMRTFDLRPQTKLIDRSDVLRLVANSQLPKAQEIEKWIFEDVVPTVIDTGTYGLEKMFPTIEGRQQLIKLMTEMNTLAVENKQLEDQKQLLEAKVLEDAPKVSMWDDFMNAEGLIDIGDAAKAYASRGFRIGRNRLYALLRTEGYLFKNDLGFNTPYQNKIEAGHIKVKYETKTLKFKIVQYPHCYLTSKGLEHIYKKFIEKGDY